MIKREIYTVSGMHCASCDIFIKHALEKEKAVAAARPYYKKKQVEIDCRDRLPIEKINERLNKYGYRLTSENASSAARSGVNPLLIGFALVAILFLIPLFKYLNLLGGRLIGLSANISFITAFLIGLVASFSTCMATTGVFFLSLNEELARRRRFSSSHGFAGLFAVGRVFSYGFFGGLIGLLGKSFIVSPKFNGVFTVVISLFMIVIALSLISDRLTLWRFQSQKLVGVFIRLAENHRLVAPLILGAATFFMPCGFTQSLQLYALQSGGFGSGALILSLFAVGTLPSIFGVSLAGRLGQKSLSRYFSPVAGVLILTFSFFNISNGLALTGVNLPLLSFSSPSVLGESVDNRQTIDMVVDASGYSPRAFTVKKGVPVTWNIQGVDLYGCQSFLVVPALNLGRQITTGLNIVEFTPQKTGQILFSCGMGMFRGVINVI